MYFALGEQQALFVSTTHRIGMGHPVVFWKQGKVATVNTVPRRFLAYPVNAHDRYM